MTVFATFNFVGRDTVADLRTARLYVSLFGIADEDKGCPVVGV